MPTGADACPGILTLHPARDGHVARIRLPGGYVTGLQWAALAALACEFGDGCVDLTARGNIQLRGLPQAAAGELARRAAQAAPLPAASQHPAPDTHPGPPSGLGGRPPPPRPGR